MAPSSKKPQGGNNKNPRDATKFNKSSKKPFKPNKDHNNAARSEAMALQLEDDVPDFPRGGGSSLNRKERDEIRAEVDAEFEAEEREMKKKGKKKRVPKDSLVNEDEMGSLFGDGITGKLPRYANKITLKNISPGMRVWGVVAEVNEKDLVISLPGGLRGLVRASDAFDPILDDETEALADSVLPSIFRIGQLVSCIVLQLDEDKKEKGKRKIWLSLRLSLLHKGFTLDSVQEGMVLTAYIKSIEDHGYILHFGLSSFTGFLPKNSQAAHSLLLTDSKVQVSSGQLLQAAVRRVDKTRKVVHMSSDPEMVSKCVTKDLKGISIDLLVPGMMVNARVLSTLENGVMLSFLTYFTGTVDIFHLQNIYPTTNWKEDYNQNKKLNARVLFVDPSTRAVGLTLNPHLVRNKAPPSHVKIGDICDDAKVVRVDRGLGLLLEIPSTQVSTPAYVSISDVAEEVRKLEKKFKEGTRVRVRILGFRHLEGLATGILKASAFEGSVFTHSDVKPGMVVRGKIIAVDSFGAIVQFPGGVKALCPLTHMSEFEIAKPRKKFKVGAELVFRVLGCKSKRITVTHKKTLVKSKLGILSSYADAADGLITHGWIRKIEERGCFVHFYNGVQGFAPRSELGLEPGSDPSSMYHVGQVIKCRVIGSNATSRRIKLSLIIQPPRVSEDDMAKLGSLVSGVVDRVTPNAVMVYVNAKGYSMGTIFTDHLADHHGLAALMKSVLKPGYEFDQLLVLDTEGNNLILSAKHSLINSAPMLPSEVSQVHPNTVVHGYICNLIDTGCFVRFLGRVTGFSPRHKAMDDHKGDLSEAYYIGQSVRSTILDVNSETGRITLSLKQSSCSSTDASFIREYFISEEKIAKLQVLDSKESKSDWSEGFSIGSVVEGKVQEAKDIGVVVSFEKYNDVFGFITQYQLAGTTVETGSIVRAVVLDVAKAEHLVDLSLKPEFITNLKQESSKSQTHMKKRRREVSDDPEMHETVNAVVEIVKENYLVLSIPKYNYAVGYASISDYNTQKFPQKQFLNGQSVNATVMALPSPTTAGRLLLLLNSLSESADTSSSKRAKKKSSYKVGSVVQAEITEIKALELRLKFGIGFHGRVRITEVNDDLLEDPFNNFRIGQTVTARIVAKTNYSDNNKKGFQWDLSLKPSLLTGSCEIEENILKGDLDFSVGKHVTGYVYKVDAEWVWLTISRNVRAQLFILDSACEPSELQEFQKRFHVGNAVSGHVLSVSKEKKLLRLVSYPFTPIADKAVDNEVSKTDANVSMLNATAHIHEGCVVGGRIIKKLPGVGGLTVQIGPHMYGRVHYSELSDSWVSNPLSGYEEGQFVKCKVVECSRSGQGTFHIDLSLRSSLVGTLCQDSNEPDNDKHTHTERPEKIDDLKPNMVIQGYVKNVSSKGCFILLSRKLDAKILVSNLSDGYVDDPEKEFPVGKLVTGRVSSVEPLSKRVEVTLKSLSASSLPQSARNNLDSLHVGDIISGRVKRVESYGLFITIDNTNVVGLCHVSELAEDKKDNFETKYKTGERVSAKVLKVDKERHRVSLGMKDLYIMDSDHTPPKQDLDEPIRQTDLVDDSKSVMCPVGSFLGDQNMDIEHENAEFQFLAQAESRALVPPLEVTLDDVDQGDDIVSQDQELPDAEDAVDDKKKKLTKKKARDEREREIRAAEERLLEKDIPRTDEEFEKLVRSSPNNSYVWIKYMEFVLSMADVEKARSIAKRALETINFREENEKLNVWVAYFNLESKYGSPPEEAVMKVFQKALQYNDPKKVHLALLGVFERSEQHKLADELADSMIKRFKKSCKVWLRRVQRLLVQQQDGVQDFVSRAEKILPKHKHIKFLSQTAILEFKCGNPERGRSMFENILRQNPKRTDLWSVYLDQEIRLGETDLIRALFERATSLSLPAKKMKFLFKKYLEYEERHGNEGRANYVKQKAMSYVENTVA
ncbi:rRNA biogenesis protein RRP5 isoform X1 [Rosa chinensis]|uniref:rRNA biogenesis protein RRP5 isoform X1 n=1 Tax=Rosa chinensis TaxID=74649 RepID=UPI001AD8DF7B|nr:rRNA biogenesis protein RRP5 isoform X1 [Rosa chinensis]